MIWEMLGSSAFVSTVGWIVKNEVQASATRVKLEAHLREDERLHDDIRERLIRLEDKLDRSLMGKRRD